MFSRNMATFLLNMIKDGQLVFDTEDEIIRDTMVTRDGEIVNARIRDLLKLEPLKTEPAETETAADSTEANETEDDK